MTLKEQIEKTIAAYEEACKKENLNYEYCNNNSMSYGICAYSRNQGFIKLDKKIGNHSRFMFPIPLDLENDFFVLNHIKDPTILKCHKARINFLKQLLKEVTQ